MIPTEVFCIVVTVDGHTIPHVEGDRETAEAKFQVSRAKFGPRNVTLWRSEGLVWDHTDPNPMLVAA